MNVLLKTRCGSMRGLRIGGSELPKNITIHLSDNSDLGIGISADKRLSRTFTFLGTRGPDNQPIYLESIEEIGFKVDEPL